MTDFAAVQPPSRKRIVVIRHAKTQQFATSDHVRTLTRRGERDSSNLGRWLSSVAVLPQIVLVSSASRARQTAELVVEQLDPGPDVVTLDELYGGTARDVLELCAQIDDDVACAAVVGHNPAMAMLAELLLSDDGRIGHFPTSAVAVIDVPGRWDDLPEESGTLVHLHTPHDT